MMRSLNLEVYHKWSPKGLWHCLTAGMYIFTSHSNDINFFTVGRAKKIELWHGVGIKGSSSGKDGKKRDEAIKSFIYKITAPHNYEKFDLFLSTGPLMNEHFTKMFNLEKGVLFDSSYPRCNFLQQPMSRILDHIRLYETLIHTEINTAERDKHQFLQLLLLIYSLSLYANMASQFKG